MRMRKQALQDRTAAGVSVRDCACGRSGHRPRTPCRGKLASTGAGARRAADRQRAEPGPVAGCPCARNSDRVDSGAKEGVTCL